MEPHGSMMGPIAIEGDRKKKEYYLPVIACEMISDLVDELCTA